MSSGLRIESVSYAFNGIRALNNISLEVERGTVHAVLGCNGAGKSVLMKIVAGVLRPQSGVIYLDDKPVSISSELDAIKSGIRFCPQDLAVFGELSILDNLFITNQITRTPFKIIDKHRSYNRTKEILKKFGINVDPHEKARHLSQAQKYLLQFGRAVLSEPQFLILDELCATLTNAEISIVFSVINELKQKGSSIIYITHRVQEIKGIADTITILKNGEVVGRYDPADDVEKLTHLMFGDEKSKRYPKLPVEIGSPLLEVSHISNSILNDVSFCLHEGEIIGIAGIAGSGRSQLLRALVNMEKITSGDIIYAEDENIRGNKSPYWVGYLPEDRDHKSLFFNLDIVRNITIRDIKQSATLLSINFEQENFHGLDIIDRLGITGIGKDGSIKGLSCGNKQKVVVSQCLYKKCKVYLFDEPTQGVDIAGKIEIYNIINELVRKGAGVVMVSSDFSEIIGMCDKILVMRDGGITATIPKEEINRVNLSDFFI
jgi:ribose transport system ATP-binding protein